MAAKAKNTVSEIISLILVVIFALLVRTFVIELFFVPTGSMKATILEGDYIFSTKYSYGFSKHSFPFSPDLFEGRIAATKPERGDIIIMRPPHNMDIRYIKRLIGLPGDEIQIKNNTLYINGIAVDRQEIGSYISEGGKEYIKFKEVLPNGVEYFSYKLKRTNTIYNYDYSNYGPYIIPQDRYFFLGDNRDESGDSRLQLGTVPFENLIAKARFVIFSTKEFLWQSDIGILEQIKRVGIWISSVRLSRIFTNLYDIKPDDEQ